MSTVRQPSRVASQQQPAAAKAAITEPAVKQARAAFLSGKTLRTKEAAMPAPVRAQAAALRQPASSGVQARLEHRTFEGKDFYVLTSSTSAMRRDDREQIQILDAKGKTLAGYDSSEAALWATPSRAEAAFTERLSGALAKAFPADKLGQPALGSKELAKGALPERLRDATDGVAKDYAFSFEGQTYFARYQPDGVTEYGPWNPKSDDEQTQTRDPRSRLSFFDGQGRAIGWSAVENGRLAPPRLALRWGE